MTSDIQTVNLADIAPLVVWSGDVESSEERPKSKVKKRKVVQRGRTNATETGSRRGRNSREQTDSREKRLQIRRIADRQRTAKETAVERTRRLGIRREAKQRRHTRETAEEKEKRLDREKLLKHQKLAGETVEAKQRRKEKSKKKRRAKTAKNEEVSREAINLKKRQRMANETPEQRQKRLDGIRRSKQKLKEKETAEAKQKRLEKLRLENSQRIANETPERRQKRLKNQALCNKRRLAKKKPEPPKEQTMELAIKKLMTTDGAELRQKFYRLMNELNLTEEKRAERRRKLFAYRDTQRERWRRPNLSEDQRDRQRQVHNVWVHNLEGNKKERHSENVGKAQKKRLEKLKSDPDIWKQHRERVYENRRRRHANETPEQRQKRNRRDTINRAKRKLRAKLQQENAPPEEIETQLDELGDKMWKEFYPTGDISTAKKMEVPKLLSELGSAPVPLPDDPLNPIDIISEEFCDFIQDGYDDAMDGPPIPELTEAAALAASMVAEKEIIDLTMSDDDDEEAQLKCCRCSTQFSSDVQLVCHLLTCNA